jgi:hypothetical protein
MQRRWNIFNNCYVPFLWFGLLRCQCVGNLALQDDWWLTNCKVFGRKPSLPSRCTVLAVFCRNWRKLRTSLVGTAGICVEIRNEQPPSASLELLLHAPSRSLCFVKSRFLPFSHLLSWLMFKNVDVRIHEAVTTNLVLFYLSAQLLFYIPSMFSVYEDLLRHLYPIFRSYN